MVALLLAVLFQSAAPVSSLAAPSAPAAKVAERPKRVCRKETVVGSTIKKKICPRPVEEVASAGEGGDAAEKAVVAQAAREP